VEPWLQAGKYVGAVVSGLAKRNGWTIAEQVGDRTPDRTQRLLNRAVWDAFAAMSVVRRFAVAGLDAAARRSGQRRGLVVGAVEALWIAHLLIASITIAVNAALSDQDRQLAARRSRSG
jgi:hypothetical protein